MRLFRTTLLLVIVMLAGAAIGFAQTDNHDIVIDTSGFAAIDLSDDSTITLAVSAPTLPGDDPTGDTDNTKYLFYTVLTQVASPQSINAQITNNSMPTGTTLSLVVSDMGGAGGTAATTQDLTDEAAHDIITAIPSARTGRTASPGSAPRLLYTLGVNPATVVATASNTTVTVTFTITEP
jgi:hypothetical protein